MTTTTMVNPKLFADPAKNNRGAPKGKAILGAVVRTLAMFYEVVVGTHMTDKERYQAASDELRMQDYFFRYNTAIFR